MSRIGQAPIEIPENVEVKIQKSPNVGSTVEVKGPKGELQVELPAVITIDQKDNILSFERTDDEQKSRALHGLFRTLVSNMIIGTTEGYQKELEIIGVGYRAEVQGDKKLVMQLGFSHKVEVAIPEEIKFEVLEGTRILISGIDKQAVGQAAAHIRSLKKPEPYKGKGIRYKDEYVRRKQVK